MWRLSVVPHNCPLQTSMCGGGVGRCCRYCSCCWRGLAPWSPHFRPTCHFRHSPSFQQQQTIQPNSPAAIFRRQAVKAAASPPARSAATGTGARPSRRCPFGRARVDRPRHGRHHHSSTARAQSRMSRRMRPPGQAPQRAPATGLPVQFKKK